MSPLYTHCPHCGYPVVVRLVEQLLPRFCRQCRGQYVPAECAHASPDQKLSSLRAKIRGRVRAISGLTRAHGVSRG